MRWAVLAFGFVILLAACGAGDDTSSDSGSSGDDALTTFTSDDGVVTVDVPPSAAPDGFTGTVSLSDSAALGVDTSDVESVLLVYELGPDGTEFDEPVTVTFRIPAALGGFDPSQGLPISLAAIEDGTGGFEPLGSMRSFLDGDVLVVEGTTTHFSTAVVEVGNVRYELVVDPPGRSKPVDSLFEVSVMEGIVEEEVFEEDPTVDRVDFSSEFPINVFNIDSATTATMECTNEGVGTARALVYSDFDFTNSDLAEIFLYTFFNENFVFLGELSLEIECVDEPEAGSSTGGKTGSLVGSDPEGDGKNDESQPVTPEEDVPGGDIKSVAYERDPSGEVCFITDVYGDGEMTAADASNEIIDYEVVGPDGEEWRARAEYFQGEPDTGFVWLGPKTSGQDTLEGATVTPVWVASDTLRTCVDSGETSLAVATFSVTMNVFTPEGSFYDYAEGIAES